MKVFWWIAIMSAGLIGCSGMRSTATAGPSRLSLDFHVPNTAVDPEQPLTLDVMMRCIGPERIVFDLHDMYLLIGPTNGLPEFRGLFASQSTPIVLPPDSTTVKTLQTTTIEYICMCPDCRSWSDACRPGVFELQLVVSEDDGSSQKPGHRYADWFSPERIFEFEARK